MSTAKGGSTEISRTTALHHYVTICIRHTIQLVGPVLWNEVYPTIILLLFIVVIACKKGEQTYPEED